MDSPADQPEHAVSPPRSDRGSDRSSDSEGKPVRDKLKETRIDAKPASDQSMKDAPTNGARADNSSGSDSDRGRLRRKRSREAFEDEETKNLEKKERHTRKKSRDITGPVHPDLDSAKPAKAVIPPIREDDNDEKMPSTKDSADTHPTAAVQEGTPKTSDSEKHATSPKNKRTREQAEAVSNNPSETSKHVTSDDKTQEEHTKKRAKDDVDPRPAKATASKSKVSTLHNASGCPLTTDQIPPTSGFANTSAASPFAAMSPQKSASKPTETSAKGLPQTSNEAFKSSGFGSFASPSVSPFGASTSGSSSPFGGAAGNKLSSFASSSAAPAAKPSGFASLGGSSLGQSAFSGGGDGSKSGFGSTFGGSAFGKVNGASTTLSSFGSGSLSITGLTQKPTGFGAKEESKADDEKSTADDGDAEESNADGEYQEPDRKASSSLLQSQGPIETGEENEDIAWTGRAKLYTLAGEAGKKAWQERGTGAFKLNVTREAPVKARFVLRADATHRLLLNAAVTSNLRFGDAEGKEPKDGKVLFTAPTASGEVESHLLRVCYTVELLRIYVSLTCCS
jgi:Ran-binding protein 3